MPGLRFKAHCEGKDLGIIIIDVIDGIIQLGKQIRIEMAILVKKHVANQKLVLAVCDASLIGKRFEEGDLQLDLTSDFYMGRVEGNEKIVKLMESANIINIVGQESVDLALKSNILSKSSVVKIKNVPHAQCVKLSL